MGPQAGEGRGLRPQCIEPLRNRIAGREARILEIVVPAEALCPAIAEPSVEAERRELQRTQLSQQRMLLGSADDVLFVTQSGDQRRVEQQVHAANSSFSSDGLSSGASWSKVHCLGSLSGR